MSQNKFGHVRAELEGLSKWLTRSVQSDPGAINVSFNKFELAHLADRINALVKETNWND